MEEIDLDFDYDADSILGDLERDYQELQTIKDMFLKGDRTLLQYFAWEYFEESASDFEHYEDITLAGIVEEKIIDTLENIHRWKRWKQLKELK